MESRRSMRRALGTISVLLSLTACTSSSPTDTDPSSWLYERFQPHDYLVLSDSRDAYDELAQEISQYYEAPLLHLDSLTTEERQFAARIIDPEYILIVIPPTMLTTGWVKQFFELCCGLYDGADDPFLDVAFGYITGYTVDEARTLFYRTKSEVPTFEDYLGVTHVFDGDSWCHNAVRNYASRFVTVDWDTSTVIVNGDRWNEDTPGEFSKFRGNQLVFFIGHGSSQTICSLDIDELEAADFNQSLVFSGACYTGAISSTEPDRSVVLKILSQGAAIYASSIVGNGWMNMQYFVESMCGCNQSIGQSFVDGINSEWAIYAPDTIQYIVLFGDPSFIPQLKTGGN